MIVIVHVHIMLICINELVCLFAHTSIPCIIVVHTTNVFMYIVVYSSRASNMSMSCQTACNCVACRVEIKVTKQNKTQKPQWQYHPHIA